jgi:hypothetical protein
MEELERIWGDPDDVGSLRDLNIKPLRNRVVKKKSEPSPV